MKKILLAIMVVCLVFCDVAVAAVDLNNATQAQLESVGGIGSTKAKAIIEYRPKNGQFKNVDELDKVTGFGKKTVDKVRSQLTVGGMAASKSGVTPAVPPKK